MCKTHHTDFMVLSCSLNPFSRPHQYGEDLLPSLSDILNKCTRENDAPVAGLALQGLHALCEAEVIDIRTMWKVLAPKLSVDKRLALNAGSQTMLKDFILLTFIL